MRSTPPVPAMLKLSDLPASRQRLVRLCQWINYGQLVGLVIYERQPVFDPEPAVLIDVKLDGDGMARAEAGLPDFVLSQEVRRLLNLIDELENGKIERLEVRAGLPRRAVVQRRLTEVGR